jgi:hypothetical protein
MEQAKARETVRAVAADLGGVADVLPVQPEQVEAKARILDRLSEELAEAAGMLRRGAPGGPTQLGNHPASAGGLNDPHPPQPVAGACRWRQASRDPARRR